jgi:hypothetical protein
MYKILMRSGSNIEHFLKIEKKGNLNIKSRNVRKTNNVLSSNPFLISFRFRPFPRKPDNQQKTCNFYNTKKYVIHRDCSNRQ